MIVNVSRATLDAMCECGEPAAPGLFSVQHLGESVPVPGSIAESGLVPMALCEPCGVESQKEHGYGVIVFRIG
jgi:hypothetical protein